MRRTDRREKVAKVGEQARRGQGPRSPGVVQMPGRRRGGGWGGRAGERRAAPRRWRKGGKCAEAGDGLGERGAKTPWPGWWRQWLR
eukprot:scaffold24407_cov23-Tisochrysis_lutea.AAC.1